MADPRILTLPARAGLQWLRSGVRLFLRQPLMLFLLVALGPLLVLLTLALLPVVGQAICLLLTPVLAVGMLSVCRAVDQGTTPGLGSYTAALLVPGARLQLLKIGVYYALVAGLLASAWSLLPDEPPAPAAASTGSAAGPREASHDASRDAGRDAGLDAIRGAGADAGADEGGAAAAVPGDAAATAAAPPAAVPIEPPAAVPIEPPAAAPVEPPATVPVEPPAPAAVAPTPLRVLVLGASLAVWLPLQMTIWFAPVLCAWHGMTAGKALFFSFFACWRNRGPMILFLSALLGGFFLALVLCAAVVTALGAGDRAAQYLLAPLPLLVLAIAQTSNLTIYRAVVDGGTVVEAGAAPA